MSIKIITEPTIYLVGKQHMVYENLYRFQDDHDAKEWETDAGTASEALPEIAGRLCYMSYSSPRPGGNKKYLGHILEVGHGSVLEHAVFNFIIAGVSRSLTHELVRHRVGFSYSQLSQRYVDESDVAFVVPPAIQEEALEAFKDGGVSRQLAARDAMSVWRLHCERSLGAYQHLVKCLEAQYLHIDDKTARRKAAREAARSVLPNATETKIFVTANARALRHFFELRTNPAADAEIRRLAVAWLRVVQEAAPNLFSDFVIEPCPLGGKMASTPHPKV